ncbi:MAG: ParB N-terminal domain-containing protein [Planctomycetia bacterium]|nr:ParB N-terminal domain-containing protein [Planctomycetia bacterium]
MSCSPQKTDLPDQNKYHGTQLETVDIDSIRPASHNDAIYGEIHVTPDIIELARSIREKGLLEPIVVTIDNVIVSGHRRYAACKWLRKKAIEITRLLHVCSTDPDFPKLVTEYNLQRTKSREQQIREQLVRMNPEEAHQSLLQHRKEQQRLDFETLDIGESKARTKITENRRHFLNAVLNIIDDLEDFWPLTDRQIHYQLLNDPPLIHAKKPKSKYRNDLKSYRQLTRLLTQARVEQRIPFDVIHDPTRPTTISRVDLEVGTFVKNELHWLLKSYHRDLMQSQRHHFEILAEKMTVENICKPVAKEYCIPLVIGRGYSSLSLRSDVAKRFRKSNKEKLILLMLSDFDPEGEDLIRSFARSLRDDFDVDCDIVKVAILPEHIQEYNLPAILEAKKTSSRAKKFIEQHGNSVYELEAIPPAELQTILRDAIDTVIDIEAFNQELDEEKKDAVHLHELRHRITAQIDWE